MTKKILGALALLLGVTAASPAMALTHVNAPWGNSPVFAVIGSYIVPTSPPAPTIVIQIVQWLRVSDGACVATQVGSASTLFDDYQIHGTTGADFFALVEFDGGETFCGKRMYPLVYGGHYLDILGNGGNDRLKNATDGDTWLDGQDGNDRLYSENPIGTEYGGPGDDSVIFWGPSGSTATLLGDAGSDCLADIVGTSSTMNCGSGSDKYQILSRPPSGAVSCETPVNSCPRP
jgi:hypothetical protein